MDEPKYKIGDRVGRALTSRFNLAEVTGWRRGTVTGIRIEQAFTMQTNVFWYSVRWDGDSADSVGYWEGGLVPEASL